MNPWQFIRSFDRKPQQPTPINHAAPLSPLRDRDLEAMLDWFDRPDMHEIEADVIEHLDRLSPEPVWEENLDSFDGNL